MLQKEFELSHLNSLIQNEMSIRKELENVLSHGELLWKQKSRCDWLKLRDKNTKFFHSHMMHRRKLNRINALRKINGDWLYDSEEMQVEDVNYFQKLYREK